MGSEYRSLSSTGSYSSAFIEMPECFICRDVELQGSDPLRNFCDCKNLLAHQTCLSTWIQTGCGSEDRLRCIICKAKYQLQRTSPWRLVSIQWQTWLVLITALVLLGLVPYIVHYMMNSFRTPPPSTFKVAATSFGILMEVLLLKCLLSYLSSRYQQAEQSSFTVRPRGFEEGRSSRGLWDRSEDVAAAAVVGRTSLAEESKVKSGCFSFSRTPEQRRV